MARDAVGSRLTGALRRLGGRVVALIGLAALAAPAPLHAETRASINGSLAAWHVFRLDPDTPREHPSSTLELRLDAVRGEHVHLFASTRIGFDGKIGDPERGNPVLDLDEIYQSKDFFLAFDEAYVDLYLDAVELRIGRQKVSWGQLDDLQPTDHLNPQDQSEFIFRPELERKIGVPGLRLRGYSGSWTADAVWNPVYTAYRFPARDDRWFPPLLLVPRRAATPLGVVPLRTRYPDVDAPPYTLSSGDAGLRVQRFLRGAELSGTVFHGWDKTATFGVEGSATLVPTGNPSVPVAPTIDLRIFPTLHRITVVGGDLAIPIWVLALRGEVAWIDGRFFPLLVRDQVAGDPRLVAVISQAASRVAASGRAETVALPIPPAELQRESLQYGIGFDYFVTEAVSRRLVGRETLAGALVLVQLIETVIFDHDAPFIAAPIEHLFGLTLRQTFRDERLLVELKAAYNPNHGEFVLWPQVAYKLRPALHALFEARVLGGARRQLIGQYRDHDGIRIGLRWFF